VSTGGDPGAGAAAAPAPSRIPAAGGARYIIGTEACERFSFYGMRNILTVFLVQNLLPLVPVPAQDRGARATEIFHLFMMGVFLFPLLGGFVADRRWGKYHTILRLSVLYVAGHALLALFDDNPTGFYAGLFLIALGSGGIKPCVAAFVGDQLTEPQRALLPKVFAAFYVAINVGSVVASFLMPLLLEHLGPRIAFGLPGLLMLIALLVFWLGRRHLQGTAAGAPPVATASFRWSAAPCGPPTVARAAAVWTGRWRTIRPRRWRRCGPWGGCCGCSPSFRSSGCCSTRRRRPGCCKPSNWICRLGRFGCCLRSCS
jgi:POT family proton-dependent oligopeptide transporter